MKARAPELAAWLVAALTLGPALAAAASWTAPALAGALLVAAERTLVRLRPAAPALAALRRMGALGAAGMGLGLQWDAGRGIGLGALSAACVSGADWASVVLRHWTWLPAMHAGMLLGCLAVWWWPARAGERMRFGQALECTAWMLLGMVAGGVAAHAWTPGGPDAAAMLGAMLAGMAWGTVAGVAARHAGPACARLRRSC